MGYGRVNMLFWTHIQKPHFFLQQTVTQVVFKIRTKTRHVYGAFGHCYIVLSA